MQLSLVRYFLAVYDELNFSRAAKRCGVSQPSLTNGILSLERQFNGRLFFRARSPQSQTQPTELAMALRPHLETLEKCAKQAQDVAKGFLRSNTSRCVLPGEDRRSN